MVTQTAVRWLKNGSATRGSGPEQRRGCKSLRELPGTRQDSGFTLLELMVVMVIIGILAAIAIPSFTKNVQRANEAVLREDLHTIRTAIDSYTIDKQKAPTTLDDLVQAGYLKQLPVDPMTHRSDTWMPSESTDFTSTDETQSGGMDNVHSGSQAIASDGTTYNTW